MRPTRSAQRARPCPAASSVRWAERGRSLTDDLVHAVGELLGGDRQLEELGDVVEEPLGGGRRERLVPRLREALRLARDAVDEVEEVGVLRGAELAVGAL